jgi:hypothetical protein
LRFYAAYFCAANQWNTAELTISSIHSSENPAKFRRAGIIQQKNKDMKTNTTGPIVKMEKEALQQLCREVKESLATDLELKEGSRQRFGIADLWNIQRSTRYRIQRRNLSL